MKKAMHQTVKFSAVLLASSLWLQLVIQLWQLGTATQLPYEVYYFARWGNYAYVISSGLPAVAFCLIRAVPLTIRCLFPQSSQWKKWYMPVAGVLLTAQTVCMLPAFRWFVSFAKKILGTQAPAVMEKMIGLYVHATLPALVLCLMCRLIQICVKLIRSKRQIPKVLRQTGTHLQSSLAIAFLVSAASMLLLNILAEYGWVNKGFINSFCDRNASNVASARTSILWAPIVEEIAFRGLICVGLAKYGRKWPAILISAVFFGLWHRNMTQFAYTFVWGIIWGHVVLTTGSIFWTMLMHFASNLMVILAYSNSSVKVFGAWPQMCALRVWLGDLPMVPSALLLTAVIVFVVVLLRCFKPSGGCAPKE